jgi:hypothetical protein
VLLSCSWTREVQPTHPQKSSRGFILCSGVWRGVTPVIPGSRRLTSPLSRGSFVQSGARGGRGWTWANPTSWRWASHRVLVSQGIECPCCSARLPMQGSLGQFRVTAPGVTLIERLVRPIGCERWPWLDAGKTDLIEVGQSPRPCQSGHWCRAAVLGCLGTTLVLSRRCPRRGRVCG